MYVYCGLNALLRSEPEATHYFDTLPDNTREQISTHSDSVNSFASLKDYAQNILRVTTDSQSKSHLHPGGFCFAHQDTQNAPLDKLNSVVVHQNIQ